LYPWNTSKTSPPRGEIPQMSSYYVGSPPENPELERELVFHTPVYYAGSFSHLRRSPHQVRPGVTLLLITAAQTLHFLAYDHKCICTILFIPPPETFPPLHIFMNIVIFPD
jgi:hypothetical protein